MGLTYNKKLITKDRRVMPSGPRDRQRKQQMEQIVQMDHSELVEELRHQITTLQNRLDSQPAGGWTDDKVNEEIAMAIRAETAELKAQLEIEKNKVKTLTEKLKDKDETIDKFKDETKKYASVLKDKDKRIQELESRPVQTEDTNKLTALLAEATKKIEDLSLKVSTGGEPTEITDPDRPQMEVKFVDPIEKESKVEKHFDVEVSDISIKKKEEMGNKVDKLKNLLGKLPSRR